MEWVAVLMFIAVVVLLLAGFPVAFSLGGTALLFAFAGVIGGGFESAFLSGLPSRIFGIMSNDTLLAVHYSAACAAASGFRSPWSACCSPPVPASWAPPWSRWACCRCRQC
jgi:hypothetical protein